MATTITPASLYVSIVESITLGGIDQGSTVSLTIASIAKFTRRILNAITTSTGTELLKLSTTEGAGQAIGSALKYLRITNLDDTNYVLLHVEGNSHYVQHKLEAGKSYLLGSDDFDNASALTSYSAEDITTVRALANTAAVQLEVVIATT